MWLAYRLAEHVEGTTDVAGMLDHMTCQQFDEWMAKDLVEPVGYATQLLAFMAYWMHGFGNKTPQPISKWLPWLKYARGNVDPDEMIRQRRAMKLHGHSG